jgi:alpha-ketoglutaric semialdehyde dehydrogenase
MQALLLLVDLQEDFLAEPGLEPHRAAVVAGATKILRECRSRNMPVCHVWTTVHQQCDDRMLHWKIAGRWSCVEGTPGHATVPDLSPLPGEAVFHKTGFSVFAHPQLPEFVRNHELVIVAGVHTHGCVRQAALGAYEIGTKVWIAMDAIGSHEPFHAAQTELYLRRRAISFLTTDEIFQRLDNRETLGQKDTKELPALAFLHENRTGSTQRTYVHYSPSDLAVARWRCMAPSRAQIDEVVRAARAPNGGARHIQERARLLDRAGDLLREQMSSFAWELVSEIGKPIRFARGEVERAANLLKVVARRAASQPLQLNEREASVCRQPHGIVAVVTPWNNPLAIPAGQIAPAFAYGNGSVWKPALPGLSTALHLRCSLLEAGIPPHCLHIIGGDDEAGLDLISHRGIDAVCFTGSTSSGCKAAVVCTSQFKPLQAELGGNNAAIVFPPIRDLDGALRAIVEAAFGFAGQRCTATRRLIILDELLPSARPSLTNLTAALTWGSPHAEATQVGPLLSSSRVERVADQVERAKAAGCEVVQPHLESRRAWPTGGAYYPPTLVLCDDPKAEIVQEETFGPVLVVQKAKDFTEAMELLNGVSQGLAASLFCGEARLQEQFLRDAKAGITKIDQPTADAGADVPFGGWKSSGIGTPQHGLCNVEFFTRMQTVYRNECR